MTEQTSTKPKPVYPHLDKRQFSQIVAGKLRYDLTKVNKRIVHCRDCEKEILPGLGIHRNAYPSSRIGYLCLDCFGLDIKVANFRYGCNSNDAGFRFDWFGRLASCYYDPADYSTLEILEAVESVLLEVAHDYADWILADEPEHPLKVGDLAAALL